MLPVIASVNSFNFQTPLVNTTTPGTNALHVPYDNVAPSASGAQVENNTQGNNTVILPPEQAASYDNTASTQVNNNGFSAQLQASQTAISNSGVQSAFVAQLAAQDGSPETQVILVQYEKIIANSNVKYKPSNALKPQEGPSNAFGRILQSEKTAAPAPATSPAPQAAPGPQAEAIAQPHPALRNNKTAPASNNDAGEPAPTSGDTAGPPAPAAANPIPPNVLNAYAATAARVANFTPPAVPSSTSAPSKEFA